MRLKSLNRVHYIKEDDTFTPIQLQVIGYDDKPFDLSEAEEIVVKIGTSDGMLAQKKLSDGTLTRMEVTGGLEFRLDVDDQLVRGANFIEVQGTINSKKIKAPSKGYYKLNIEKSMDSIGQVVTKITLDYFIEKVDERIAQIQGEIDLLHDTREYFETHLDETVDLAVDNKMTPFVKSRFQQGVATITGVNSNGYFRSDDPFVTVSIDGFPQNNAPNYDVVLTPISGDTGLIGNLEAYDKTQNGFKVRMTGSAKSVTFLWTILNPNV